MSYTIVHPYYLPYSMCSKENRSIFILPVGQCTLLKYICICFAERQKTTFLLFLHDCVVLFFLVLRDHGVYMYVVYI